jgi:hypothetical protein
MEQQRAHENKRGFTTARWAGVPEIIETIIANMISDWERNKMMNIPFKNNLMKDEIIKGNITWESRARMQTGQRDRPKGTGHSPGRCGGGGLSSESWVLPKVFRGSEECYTGVQKVLEGLAKGVTRVSQAGHGSCGASIGVTRGLQ